VMKRDKSMCGDEVHHNQCEMSHEEKEQEGDEIDVQRSHARESTLIDQHLSMTQHNNNIVSQHLKHCHACT
jgi:hypothetical protein